MDDTPDDYDIQVINYQCNRDRKGIFILLPASPPINC